MTTITPENIAPNQCVARQGARFPAELWFAPWFIEQGFFEGPQVKYTVNWNDGPVTVRQEWKDGRLRVWRLTGYRYYADGYWLGVFPD